MNEPARDARTPRLRRYHHQTILGFFAPRRDHRQRICDFAPYGSRPRAKPNPHLPSLWNNRLLMHLATPSTTRNKHFFHPLIYDTARLISCRRSSSESVRNPDITRVSDMRNTRVQTLVRERAPALYCDRPHRNSEPSTTTAQSTHALLCAVNLKLAAMSAASCRLVRRRCDGKKLSRRASTRAPGRGHTAGKRPLTIPGSDSRLEYLIYRLWPSYGIRRVLVSLITPIHAMTFELPTAPNTLFPRHVTLSRRALLPISGFDATVVLFQQ